MQSRGARRVKALAVAVVFGAQLVGVASTPVAGAVSASRPHGFFSIFSGSTVVRTSTGERLRLSMNASRQEWFVFLRHGRLSSGLERHTWLFGDAAPYLRYDRATDQGSLRASAASSHGYLVADLSVRRMTRWQTRSCPGGSESTAQFRVAGDLFFRTNHDREGPWGTLGSAAKPIHLVLQATGDILSCDAGPYPKTCDIEGTSWSSWPLFTDVYPVNRRIHALLGAFRSRRSNRIVRDDAMWVKVPEPVLTTQPGGSARLDVTTSPRTTATGSGWVDSGAPTDQRSFRCDDRSTRETVTQRTGRFSNGPEPLRLHMTLGHDFGLPNGQRTSLSTVTLEPIG